MNSAVTCELLLYADDSALLVLGEDINLIQHFLRKQLQELSKSLVQQAVSAIATNILKKENFRLNFSPRKLLACTLVQCHFDHACSAWRNGRQQSSIKITNTTNKL